jgi:hypothetical protein
MKRRRRTSATGSSWPLTQDGEGGKQRGRGLRSAPYFNELLIDENLVFNVVPIPSTAAMITNAMPVAIRQYSIAVAPDSSERNARTVFMLSTYRASLSVG